MLDSGQATQTLAGEVSDLGLGEYHDDDVRPAWPIGGVTGALPGDDRPPLLETSGAKEIQLIKAECEGNPGGCIVVSALFDPPLSGVRADVTAAGC